MTLTEFYEQAIAIADESQCKEGIVSVNAEMLQHRRGNRKEEVAYSVYCSLHNHTEQYPNPEAALTEFANKHGQGEPADIELTTSQPQGEKE